MLSMRIFICVMGFMVGSSGISLAGNLVVNGSFEGPFGDPNYHIKERFSEIQPFGWSGGDKLTYLCFPGTAADGKGTLSVWMSPGDSPDGGNFIMADGDPVYSDSFYQTLTGLTVGQQYAVSFYQAAGQNFDKSGPTFEEWKVTFGNTTLTSHRMQTPSHGMHPWEKQTLIFIAQNTSERLSFLAYGGPGSGPITGLPPVVFLDGVNVSAVPEPSALALSALGLLGFGVLHLRRRAKLRQVSFEFV